MDDVLYSRQKSMWIIIVSINHPHEGYFQANGVFTDACICALIGDSHVILWFDELIDPGAF